MGACNSNCISTAKTAVENILNDINKLNRKLNSVDDETHNKVLNSMEQILTLLNKRNTQSKSIEKPIEENKSN